MKLAYPIVVHPTAQASGGYTVTAPDLPGCVARGKDFVSALESMRNEACRRILEGIGDGLPLPQPTDMSNVKPDEPGAFASLLDLDLDAYAESHGGKAVRKNVTIPAYLDHLAAVRHLSYSALLSDAIERTLLGKEPAGVTVHKPANEREGWGRIPFDRNYAIELGKTIYYFNYLENTLLSILFYLDPKYRRTYFNSSSMTSGQFANDLLQKVEKRSWAPKQFKEELRDLFIDFQSLARKRNALLHAHPISDKDDEYAQILYYQGGSTAPIHYCKWTETALAAFAVELHDADMKASDLYARIGKDGNVQ